MNNDGINGVLSQLGGEGQVSYPRRTSAFISTTSTSS